MIRRVYRLVPAMLLMRAFPSGRSSTVTLDQTVPGTGEIPNDSTASHGIVFRRKLYRHVIPSGVKTTTLVMLTLPAAQASTISRPPTTSPEKPPALRSLASMLAPMSKNPTNTTNPPDSGIGERYLRVNCFPPHPSDRKPAIVTGHGPRVLPLK
jgi:hypothetical protein